MLVFRQAGEIPIGQYAFPFDFDLPPDLPGSFRVQEGNMYASILYKVKAEVRYTSLHKPTLAPLPGFDPGLGEGCIQEQHQVKAPPPNP